MKIPKTKRVQLYLRPIGQRIWDALQDKDKSEIIHRLMVLGMSTQEGKALIKEKTGLTVSTADGCISLSNKE
jgi:hypothetical protein